MAAVNENLIIQDSTFQKQCWQSLQRELVLIWNEASQTQLVKLSHYVNW